MIDLKVPLLDLIDAHGEAHGIVGDVRRDIDERAEALMYADKIRQEIVARLAVIRSGASIGGATSHAVNGSPR